MVDRRHLERLVVVEFKGSTATLRKRPRGANLAELRAALGLVGADNFLFGAANLVVEGPSDRVYVDRFAERLGILDPDFVAVVVAGKDGGAGEVDSTVRALKELGTRVAVLLDNDRRGREAAKLLRNRRRLPDDYVLIPDEDDTTAEMAIEDYLDLDTLLKCVNDVHRLEGEEALTREALVEFRAREGPATQGPRWDTLPIARAIDKWVEKYRGREFDKIGVAIAYCNEMDRTALEPPPVIVQALRRIDRVLCQPDGQSSIPSALAAAALAQG